MTFVVHVAGRQYTVHVAGKLARLDISKAWTHAPQHHREKPQEGVTGGSAGAQVLRAMRKEEKLIGARVHLDLAAHAVRQPEVVAVQALEVGLKAAYLKVDQAACLKHLGLQLLDGRHHGHPGCFRMRLVGPQLFQLSPAPRVTLMNAGGPVLRDEGGNLSGTFHIRLSGA